MTNKEQTNHKNNKTKFPEKVHENETENKKNDKETNKNEEIKINKNKKSSIKDEDKYIEEINVKEIKQEFNNKKDKTTNDNTKTKNKESLKEEMNPKTSQENIHTNIENSKLNNSDINIDLEEDVKEISQTEYLISKSQLPVGNQNINQVKIESSQKLGLNIQVDIDQPKFDKILERKAPQVKQKKIINVPNKKKRKGSENIEKNKEVNSQKEVAFVPETKDSLKEMQEIQQKRDKDMKKALKRTLREALLKSQPNPKKSSRYSSRVDNTKEMSIINEENHEHEEKEIKDRHNISIEEIKLDMLPAPPLSKTKQVKVFKKGAIKFIKK